MQTFPLFVSHKELLTGDLHLCLRPPRLMSASGDGDSTSDPEKVCGQRAQDCFREITFLQVAGSSWHGDDLHQRKVLVKCVC